VGLVCVHLYRRMSWKIWLNMHPKSRLDRLRPHSTSHCPVFFHVRSTHLLHLHTLSVRVSWFPVSLTVDKLSFLDRSISRIAGGPAAGHIQCHTRRGRLHRLAGEYGMHKGGPSRQVEVVPGDKAVVKAVVVQTGRRNRGVVA
jgi:hypothetical protein